MKIKDQVKQYAQIFQNDLNLKQLNDRFNGLNVEPELQIFQYEINSLKKEISSLKESITIKLDDHQNKVNTFYSRLDEINFHKYRPAKIKRIY